MLPQLNTMGDYEMKPHTIRQCNGAFGRINGEQASLVPDVSLRDQTDLGAQLRHSRCHDDAVAAVLDWQRCKRNYNNLFQH